MLAFVNCIRFVHSIFLNYLHKHTFRMRYRLSFWHIFCVPERINCNLELFKTYNDILILYSNNSKVFYNGSTKNLYVKLPTICSRSLDPSYVLSYCIKWVKTSLTEGDILIRFFAIRYNLFSIIFSVWRFHLYVLEVPNKKFNTYTFLSQYVQWKTSHHFYNSYWPSICMFDHSGL